MGIYQIDYDLRKQRNYESLYERIKSYPNWCHPLESTWVIRANHTATQIRDHLLQAMDKDHGLLVTRLTGEAAWHGLGDKVADWLRQELPKAA